MITFKAEPFQEKFIMSPDKFPCYAGGWGTGKTLSAITRAEIYSKSIPDNLGCIFRKTARSLNDSTLQDFQKYTGHKVSADRNYQYPNGSVAMFRHLDELDSINQQNINLGWFYIEQGEELDSDREFWMLIGRLRRNLKPSPEFLKLGLPLRSGWVICNAGDNWIRKGWKDEPFKGSSLVEASTWDNAHNLPVDFLDTLRVLEIESPELYKQFVLNSWDASKSNRVFPRPLIEMMKLRYDVLSIGQPIANIGVTVDPSGMGADDNVFLAGNNGLPLEWYEKTVMSATDKAYTALNLCKKHGGWWILIDCDGVGIETYKELIDFDDRIKNGIQILKFHGSAPSGLMFNTGPNNKPRQMYANMRAEAAMVTQRRAYSGWTGIAPTDKKCIRQLEADISFQNGRGLLQLIDKTEIKKLIGESPGRADCFKMMNWACHQEYADQTFSKEAMQQAPQAFADTSDSIYGPEPGGDIQRYADNS
jgi:hypothetical protein